uniref:Uncharacterized protein n=1 Tax=Nelumbo nucifera TaxID=4432 RepID=A0A822ZCJ6_NELNU|nr:TPA_asm: hypothetical protein HUJ06_015059 [Nelumbo nucifera]
MYCRSSHRRWPCLILIGRCNWPQQEAHRWPVLTTLVRLKKPGVRLQSVEERKYEVIVRRREEVKKLSAGILAVDGFWFGSPSATVWLPMCGYGSVERFSDNRIFLCFCGRLNRLSHVNGAKLFNVMNLDLGCVVDCGWWVHASSEPTVPERGLIQSIQVKAIAYWMGEEAYGHPTSQSHSLLDGRGS